MRPRRVLYADFYAFVGGAQVNLLSLFGALDRQRYQPLLLLPKEGPFAKRARALGVEVLIEPMGKARWRLFWQAWPAYHSIKALLRRERVELVHANCYPVNKLVGPAAHALGLPAIWHKQIAVTQRPGSTTGALFRYFSRYNTKLLAVSKQGVAGLRALGIPEAKVELFYNNADAERIAAAKPISDKELRAWGVPKGAKLVLAAGMRRPHKGFDVLLRAWLRVRAPKAHLVLIGDITPSEAAHEALLRDLASDPSLRGRLSVLPGQGDLAPWLKRADLFVSASRWEGSPLVVLEAMAAGKPIVATQEGAGEILRHGKTAWLVPAEDPAALAAALDKALSSAVQRRARAAAAKRELRAHYSLKAYAAKMMGLYDRLLRGDRA